jgi:drug/metabolite transporter (DMT)-like permease
MVAVGVASAVAIFVWGKEGHGEISVLGDILAVAAGLGFAALLLVYRHAAKITPLGTSMMPSTCAGSTLSVFAGLAIAKGNIGLTNGVFSILLLAFDGGVLVGGAMLLYTIGPKYITAAEVALMCLLEPCLGPIWVFIALGQVPSLVSIVAGGVLVASLAAHEIVPLCLSKKVLVDREPTATTKPRPSQSREGGDVEMAQKMLSRENSDIKV